MTTSDTAIATDLSESLLTALGDDAAMVTIPDGDRLCRAGEQSTTWWYVDDGLADVTVDGIFVGNIGTGEVIGEMAALDGTPRIATVTARGDMRARVGTAAQLRVAVARSPWLALAVGDVVARRLRATTERLESARPASTRLARSSASTSVAVTFDPLTPGYFDDPSVQLGALREQKAVHFVTATDGYLVTRYEHVHALARDRRLGNSIEHARSNPQIDAERAMLASSPTVSILRRDGDEHTRVRRLLQKSFTPKTIATWRERTEQATEALLDQLHDAGGGDLIGDYALRLPVQIISDMLGLPTDDVDRLRDWSHSFTQTLDPICTQSQRDAAVVARRDMGAYIEDMYAEKRRRPDDGLLSTMIAAEDHGDRLTHAEVIVHTMSLFAAGHETTTNLIGNGAIELFRHPDQRVLLMAEPDLDANTVEEVLRYNSPVQMIRRIPVEDIELDGTSIPAGSVVTLCSASANRDPRKWGDDADEFRIDRAGANDQLAFGGGPHFCLGAALARLEGQIALPRLFRRFPRLRPTTEPRFENRIVLRGVAALPVEI